MRVALEKANQRMAKMEVRVAKMKAENHRTVNENRLRHIRRNSAIGSSSYTEMENPSFDGFFRQRTRRHSGSEGESKDKAAEREEQRKSQHEALEKRSEKMGLTPAEWRLSDEIEPEHTWPDAPDLGGFGFHYPRFGNTDQASQGLNSRNLATFKERLDAAL